MPLYEVGKRVQTVAVAAIDNSARLKQASGKDSIRDGGGTISTATDLKAIHGGGINEGKQARLEPPRLCA